MYIADQESLEAFARSAEGARVLAVDTEFLREKTYYPKLCLLQLSADDRVAVVDPFSIESLDPLKPLFANKGIVKLFHAGGQDLEIILHEMGMLPNPVFDSAIRSRSASPRSSMPSWASSCARSTRLPTGPSARCPIPSFSTRPRT